MEKLYTKAEPLTEEALEWKKAGDTYRDQETADKICEDRSNTMTGVAFSV